MAEAERSEAEGDADATGFRLDPGPLLRTCALIFGPLRFYGWMLLPSVTGVLIWLTLAASPAARDVLALLPPHHPVQAACNAILALLVVALVPPLSQAVIATYFGYDTPGVAIRLRRGFAPYLAFDDGTWLAMLPQHVLTVVGAPCLARLVLFIAGTGLFLAYGAKDDGLAAFALALGGFGLLSFLLSTAPFLPSQGRRWLATAFAVRDAWRADPGYRFHALILSLLWGLAVVMLLLIAAGGAASLLAAGWQLPVTVQTLQAVALPLAALMPLLVRFWIKSMLRSYGALQPSYALLGSGATAFDSGGVSEHALRRSRMLVDRTTGAGRIQGSERSNKTLYIWAVVLAVVIAVAFVAYPYEAGGYFTILPYDSSQLNARVSGELTEVLVNEGDEVKPGQILGILSDWQQKYNLATAKAQLQNAEANLQNLLSQPRPEDVELARKQYEAAMSRLPYDRSQFQRYAALVTNDNVSRANYDQVLSQYQQDQAAAEVARANYDSVRDGPTPAQIEAARALVRQYTATVAFDEDELERTRIRATSYGKVVTQNPMLLRGKWFTQGTLVFTVEDHRIVQADVQVPETDIANVRLGGPVRLRLWGNSEQTVLGRSTAIAPDAQSPTSANPQTVQSGTSNVIRVRAEVPNPDGLLHPQTDGYAKMSGYYMPTWRAFGQMMERFLLVEIWSWIP